MSEAEAGMCRIGSPPSSQREVNRMSRKKVLPISRDVDSRLPVEVGELAGGHAAYLKALR